MQRRLKSRSTPDPKYYKSKLVIKEVDGGKVVNSRSYTLSVASDVTGAGGAIGEIRAEEKIPFQTEGKMEQMNVGTSIDIRKVTTIGDRLSLVITGNVSSVAAPAQPLVLPTTREMRMSTYALVPVKSQRWSSPPTSRFRRDNCRSN